MKDNRSFGLTAPELIIVIACLAILGLIILPPLITKARQRSGRISCTCNLKQIGLSFRTWALDHQDRYPLQVPATNGGTMDFLTNGSVWASFQALSNELATPRPLVCPQDRTRKYALSFSTNFGDANISYFLGVDATDQFPQMFLSGDDNLLSGGTPFKRGLVTVPTNAPLTWSAARHQYQGNVALADGSVQQFNNARLWEAFTNTGVTTNRLIFP